MPFIDRFLLRLLGKGQVAPSQEIFDWIKTCASDDSVESIVELGTYTGLGTSRAILEGMKLNPKAISVGIEVDEKLAKIARKNVASNKNYRVLHGSLITSEQLDSSDLTEVEKKWFANDLAMLTLAPSISLSQIPDRIDLLVSDGGEFGGYAELTTLLSRCSRFIVLDDVSVRKNSQAFQFLSSLEGWRLVSRSTERNGTALFEKDKTW
jgi:hypothetical protein